MPLTEAELRSAWDRSRWLQAPDCRRFTEGSLPRVYRPQNTVWENQRRHGKRQECCDEPLSLEHPPTVSIKQNSKTARPRKMTRVLDNRACWDGHLSPVLTKQKAYYKRQPFKVSTTQRGPNEKTFLSEDSISFRNL